MSAFKHAFKLVLSETVKLANGKGKHEKVGEALIPCPILADFGITAEQAKDDKGAPAFDNGIPLYVSPIMDWLQSAVVLAVTVKVRNKFSKGVLKPGMELPADFDALTAETARTGEALALRREARTSFENYLRSKNLKDAVVASLGELFWNSSKVLGSVSDKYLQALKVHTEHWCETLSEAEATRFAPKLIELQDSITQAEEGEDLLGEAA